MNTPKLRFPEFKDEWLKDNLKSRISLLNGYAFKSKDSCSNGIRWVKIADVGIGNMKDDSPSYLPKSYLEEYRDYILYKDDYVIALTRPILNGKLKIAKIDTNQNKSLLNQRVAKLIASKSYIDYIYYLLQTSFIIKSIENNIAGTDPPNLSYNDIKNIKTYFPSLPEQTKIANFLSTVDKKIELLNNKLNLLEEYKKGAMQKLFSQEVRFKDKNGEEFSKWVRVKASKIFSILRGEGLPKVLLVQDGCYQAIHYGQLFTEYKEIIKTIKSRTNYKGKRMSKYGDILMPSSDVTPLGLAKASAILVNSAVLGSDMNILRPRIKNINSIFFSYQLNFNKTNIIRLVSGTTVKHIYPSDIKSLTLLLPSLPEQTKIANFLSSIDSKIELATKELHKTEEYKKGLLQQMFI